MGHLGVGEICAFAAAFGAVFLLTDRVARRAKSVAALKRRAQLEFSSYTVSTVHAVLCLMLNVRELAWGQLAVVWGPELKRLSYFLPASRAATVLRTTLGYFLYDVLLMLFMGGYAPAFFLHHAMPLIIWPWVLQGDYAMCAPLREFSQRPRMGHSHLSVSLCPCLSSLRSPHPWSTSGNRENCWGTRRVGPRP